LGFLHERYLAGELVVFNAVASPYRDRSHFDGQNVLENGLTKPIGTADGWLNRALAALPPAHDRRSAERAVAISQNVPLILRGDARVISKSPQATPDIDEDLLARLADLYSTDDWFSARLSEAVQTEKLSEGANPAIQPTLASPPDLASQPHMASAQAKAAPRSRSWKPAAGIRTPIKGAPRERWHSVSPGSTKRCAHWRTGSGPCGRKPPYSS
jgi:uncharacterized protein (DUF1501 family)